MQLHNDFVRVFHTFATLAFSISVDYVLYQDRTGNMYDVLHLGRILDDPRCFLAQTHKRIQSYSSKIHHQHLDVSIENSFE